MNVNVFFNSNILIYTYSNTETEKQSLARKLVSENNSFISTQVLTELTNILSKKFKLEYTVAKNVIKETCKNNKLHINTEQTILLACDIADIHRFSFYDSLIIAAAIECNCNILYSEDMHHGMVKKDTLKIVNPFL